MNTFPDLLLSLFGYAITIITAVGLAALWYKLISPKQHQYRERESSPSPPLGPIEGQGESNIGQFTPTQEVEERQVPVSPPPPPSDKRQAVGTLLASTMMILLVAICFHFLLAFSYPSTLNGLLLGGVLWGAVALPVIATTSLFERKSWKFLLMNAGYWLVCLCLIGGIMGTWI